MEGFPRTAPGQCRTTINPLLLRATARLPCRITIRRLLRATVRPPCRITMHQLLRAITRPPCRTTMRRLLRNIAALARGVLLATAIPGVEGNHACLLQWCKLCEQEPSDSHTD